MSLWDYLFWNEAGVGMKTFPVSFTWTLPYWENVYVHSFSPLAPLPYCKLIPYVECTRGLPITSKYNRATVWELQGAHLNSSSVLVQQGTMFQSAEEKSFLKGPIDDQWIMDPHPHCSWLVPNWNKERGRVINTEQYECFIHSERTKFLIVVVEQRPSEALLCVGGLIHTFVVCTRTSGDSFFWFGGKTSYSLWLNLQL